MVNTSIRRASEWADHHQHKRDKHRENQTSMLQRDLRLTIMMLSDELDIPGKIVRKITTQDLRKGKLCSRFVTHHLTEEQEWQRKEYCGDFIGMTEI